MIYLLKKQRAMIRTVTAIPKSRTRTQLHGPFSKIGKEAHHQQAIVEGRLTTLTIMRPCRSKHCSQVIIGVNLLLIASDVMPMKKAMIYTNLQVAVLFRLLIIKPYINE